MKSLVFLGMALLCAVFVAGPQSVLAASSSPDLGGRFDRIEDRFDEVRERLEERFQEIEERFDARRQSVCDRLIARGFTNLPPYCEDSGPEDPTLTFTASPNPIIAGATSTLTWDSDNTDTCEASGGWSGDRDTDGSFVVGPSATTTYTLTCEGEGGEIEKSVTLGVTEDGDEEPEVPTVSLSANPLSVLSGGTTTLSWNSDDATSCEAANGWSGSKALDGSEVVTVNATTTYELTCVGEGGTTTDSVTVAVTDEDVDAPTVTLDANPLTVLSGGTTTLSWNSDNATSCEADEGWSGSKALDGSEVVVVNASTTYELTCVGDGGTTTDSVSVTVSATTTADHILISEVLYDVANDGSQGSEGMNEWVELYNPTDSAVELMNYMIGNSTTTADVLSTTSLMLMPGEYLLITNATSTADFWDLTGVDVVYLGSSISGGLANTGDYVALFDESEDIVDAVSYGTDTTAFSPSVTDVTEGHSIHRDPVGVDTNSALDWEDEDSPTPGT